MQVFNCKGSRLRINNGINSFNKRVRAEDTLDGFDCISKIDYPVFLILLLALTQSWEAGRK